MRKFKVVKERFFFLERKIETFDDEEYEEIIKKNYCMFIFASNGMNSEFKTFVTMLINVAFFLTYHLKHYKYPDLEVN